MNWAATLQIMNGLIIAAGIPWIIGALISIGNRFHKLDSLDEFIRKDMYPDLKNIKERLAFLEGRLSAPKESL
jgi:hypothetical protein